MPTISFQDMLNTVDIELSGYCNCHCTFCPRDRMSRPQSFLSPDLLDILLKELSGIHSEGPEAIYLCGFGEPLLNRNFSRMVEQIAEVFPDSFIVLVSNGSLLTQEVCDQILTGSMYCFSCSMQSIDKKQYEAAMPGADFDNVMHWLKYLAQRKDDTGLQVTVTCVRTSQTDEQIRDYVRFWDRLGVKSGESVLHSRGGFLDAGTSAGRGKKLNCNLFNSRLFVAANGDVLGCCQDLDGQSLLGTIGKDSLTSILEKKARIISSGVSFPMCAGCNDANA